MNAFQAVICCILSTGVFSLFIAQVLGQYLHLLKPSRRDLWPYTESTGFVTESERCQWKWRMFNFQDCMDYLVHEISLGRLVILTRARATIRILQQSTGVTDLKAFLNLCDLFRPLCWTLFWYLPVSRKLKMNQAFHLQRLNKIVLETPKNVQQGLKWHGYWHHDHRSSNTRFTPTRVTSWSCAS